MAKKKKKTTKKSTAKKTASKKKAKATEPLLVISKTKEALKAHDVNIGGDALEGLNTYVHWLITQAAERASMNNRKTVRAHDFII